ncbi:MAG TPA: NAD(P)-dependent alcohol dehydrogenase [Acidobacteriaceae bacterium]
MKLWTIPAFGIDQLALLDREPPQPAAGEVLVRVHAVSLNYRDLMTVQGTYNPRLTLPRIPLSDGAGEVVSLGAGVTRFAPGDRVAAIFMQNWLDGPPNAARYKGALGGDIDGMFRQYIALPEQGLVPIPGYLSWEQAATLPCAAVTAWNALTRAGIRSGDVVLIQGTGGVSLFALQFARLLGARVLGTSSSDEKLARATALGLDAGVNYRTQPDWAEWALQQTGGEGVDLVVEVGGSGTLSQSLKATRIGGSIAQIGVLSSSGEPPAIAQILRKQLLVRGIYVGSRADFEAMNRALAQSRLAPVIDQVFALDQAPAAFTRMQNASHFGKLVIKMD